MQNYPIKARVVNEVIRLGIYGRSRVNGMSCSVIIIIKSNIFNILGDKPQTIIVNEYAKQF